MTCQDFLSRYTDFRDGVIPSSREIRRFERHLAGCRACREYDAAVRRGVVALQALRPVAPSTDFRQRLEQRLAAERTRMALPPVPRRARVTAALLVAAAVTLFIMEAVYRPPLPQTASLPPVPFPKPVARAGVPFVAFQDPRASVLVGNPNPYGTALVEPASNGR